MALTADVVIYNNTVNATVDLEVKLFFDQLVMPQSFIISGLNVDTSKQNCSLSSMDGDYTCYINNRTLTLWNTMTKDPVRAVVINIRQAVLNPSQIRAYDRFQVFGELVKSIDNSKFQINKTLLND